MTSHMSLYAYYKLIFELKYYHKFSIEEVENLIPFERDLFVDMILKEKEKDRNDINNTSSSIPTREEIYGV